MVEELKDVGHKPSPPPPIRLPKYDLDAKWDACLDLSIRRVAYSSLAGAFAALLLFRSPTTRWVSVAFGAGVGVGRSYTECSYIFDGSRPKLQSRDVSAVPPASAQVSSMLAQDVSAVPPASAQGETAETDTK